MDPVSIGVAVLMLLGLVGTDAALNSGAVTVELHAGSPHYGSDDAMQGIGGDFAEALMCAEIQRIIETKSIYRVPQLRGVREKSIASAVTEWLHLREIAEAIQHTFLGTESAYIRAAVSGDKSHKKLVVLGTSSYARNFTAEIMSRPEEPTVDLLRRAAFEIALHLEPYFAALHRVETATTEPQILAAKALITRLQDDAPALPRDPERARYLNLLGILDLMQGDVKQAGVQFADAVAADPDNVAAALNLSFIDIREARPEDAIKRLTRLADLPLVKRNPLLAASALATLGTAHAARADEDAAEAVFKAAVKIHPNGSIGPDVWSRFRAARGDARQAEELAERAWANAVFFENYAELVVLRFELTWRQDVPLARSPWRITDRKPVREGGMWDFLKRKVEGAAGLITGGGTVGDLPSPPPAPVPTPAPPPQ